MVDDMSYITSTQPEECHRLATKLETIKVRDLKFRFRKRQFYTINEVASNNAACGIYIYEPRHEKTNVLVFDLVRHNQAV